MEVKKNISEIEKLNNKENKAKEKALEYDQQNYIKNLMELNENLEKKVMKKT
ncbi:MAG: hypothetical protein IMZ49_00050, partial [Actinobacteria bacterium]|nr:hypothetical protein [Actinomycetota bacterium]